MLFNIAPALLLASNNWLPYPRKPSNITQDSALPDMPKFSWDKLPANETLVYQDCYRGLQCAKLQVPMDWNADEADNRTVEIAVVRLPAIVPVTDTRYGGAIIMNPGGPGGSGADYVHSKNSRCKTLYADQNQVIGAGQDVQTMVSAGPGADNQTAKYFDIIGFDPRGVSNTRPTFRCFPSSIEREIFQAKLEAYGTPGSNDIAFTNIWTLVRTWADSCSKRAIEAGIGEHMSTQSVARDILEIVERHGEWREQQARGILMSSGKSEKDLPAHVKYQPGEEMIQFWGISYGTVLGATLADMYSDRVKRVILDGVVDSFDYYKGDLSANLQDTDLAITKFVEYCWLGGPENCALYHDKGLSFIAQRFKKIMQKLSENPIGDPGSARSSAELITSSNMKSLFFNAAYRPLDTFGKFAANMAAVDKGHVPVFLPTQRVDKPWGEQGISESCKKDGPYSPACDPDYLQSSQDVIFSAVICSDAEDHSNMTKEEYWDYTQDMMKQSRVMGDAFTNRLPCTQWHARANWRYEGDFNATTAHPILFLANAVDPVTPIRNAFKMSKGFQGSVVLPSDMVGHSSSAGVSSCTSHAVRHYFQSGELPDENLVCSPDRLPMSGGNMQALPKGETDEALWRAMIGMTEHRVAGIMA